MAAKQSSKAARQYDEEVMLSNATYHFASLNIKFPFMLYCNFKQLCLDREGEREREQASAASGGREGGKEGAVRHKRQPESGLA